MPLFEIKPVSQFEGEMLRRWVDDDEGFFDLIAWINDEGNVSGFQLCYGITAQERAITWLGGAFSHRNVDTGDESPLSNDSSILADTAVFPITDLIDRFRESSCNIDPVVRNTLIERLAEFAETSCSDLGD